MHVLVVDDDTLIRRIVGDGLHAHGIDTVDAGTVAQALEELRRRSFDVVILDLTLPDGSGAEVLESLRESASPAHVIVLSGASTEHDRVSALGSGADDYVVKPFFVGELIARVRSVQRRRAAREGRYLRFGRFEIDLEAKVFSADGAPVHLTTKEYALLAFLAARPGHVFSRDELLRAVWHSAPDWQSAATVTEHVRRVRVRIEADPGHPRLLRTVRGAGYRFDMPPDASLADVAPPNAGEVGVGISVDGRIVHADDAASRMLGRSGQALVGVDVLDLTTLASRPALQERVRRTAAGRSSRSQILVALHPDGTELPLEVTTTMVEWQGQQAVRFELRHAIHESARHRHLMTGVFSEVTDAVIVTDLDFHIRSWNDAAERLYGWTEAEVLGRHALDIVEWVDDDVLAQSLAEIEASGRWHGEGGQLTRDGSVVAVRSSVNLVSDEKGVGIGIVAVNRHVALAAIATRPLPDDAAIADLRRGLDEHELVVHYQPVVVLADGGIITVEALVRWDHPDRGLLQPDAFIDTAVRGDLIVDLGRFVLRTACAQVATWRRGGADVSVAVNLSARELADPALFDRVRTVLADAGLEPKALWLEVTESSLVEDVQQASGVLQRLTDLGVGISIDDFGTGWASLTYLRAFPVHVLKIDRSFVSGIAHERNSAAIVRSILSLGAELGLVVVAEGIETPAEARALQNLGCLIGQGFLYGRPVAAADIDVDRMFGFAGRPERAERPVGATTPAPFRSLRAARGPRSRSAAQVTAAHDSLDPEGDEGTMLDWKPTLGQVALVEFGADGDDCFTGIVRAFDGRVVGLDLGDSTCPPEAGSAVTVSLFSPDALYRVEATLSQHDDSRSSVDLTLGRIERVQRRATPRVKLDVPLVLSNFDETDLGTDGGAFASVPGRSVDIGEGGCRVVLDRRFPVGRDPTVSLHLSPVETVVAVAAVLQEERLPDGRYEYRLVFIDQEDDHRDLLARVIASC